MKKSFTYIRVFKTLIIKVSRLPYRATLSTGHSFGDSIWLKREQQALQQLQSLKLLLSSSLGLEEQHVLVTRQRPLAAISTVQLPILRAPGQETDAVLRIESWFMPRRHYAFGFSSERGNTSFCFCRFELSVLSPDLKGSDQQGSSFRLENVCSQSSWMCLSSPWTIFLEPTQFPSQGKQFPQEHLP